MGIEALCTFFSFVLFINCNSGLPTEKSHRQYSHRTEDAYAEVGTKYQTKRGKKVSVQVFDALIQIQGQQRCLWLQGQGQNYSFADACSRAPALQD
jgi:hypothetical protein